MRGCIPQALAVAAALLVSAAAAGHDDGEGNKRRAELDWAKQTATDFLGAYLHGPTIQAVQLLTPEFRKLPGDVLEAILLDARNSGFRRAEVKTELLAPGRNEAVFRGELFTEKADRVADFTVRVSKGSEGTWRVSFFRFEERAAKPAPPKK
jgi:hypothetical protein